MSQSQSAERGDRVAERGIRGGRQVARAFPGGRGKVTRLRGRTGEAAVSLKAGEP